MEQPATQSAFSGTFVFCHTPTLISIFQGVLLVDRDGAIVRVVKVENSDVLSVDMTIQEMGWSLGDTSIFNAADNEFFFPGFIGKNFNVFQHTK